MLHSIYFRDAEALLLLENFNFNETQLKKGYIRQIADVHNGHEDPRIRVADLPIQFEDFLVCSEDDDSLRLSIKDHAVENSAIPGITRLKEEAGKTVTGLVEQTSSTTLVINRDPKLDSDLRILPGLPAEAKVLHIRDCPTIFHNPTSWLTSYPGTLGLTL
jgi:hypothetical protein